MNIDEMVTLIQENDEELMLDEMVHDVKSEEASEINNTGVVGQLEFLIEALGKEEVDRRIKENL